MKQFHYMLLCCFLLCWSCDKEIIETSPTQLLDRNINLSNFQWGQESRYVAYTANCKNVDGTFRYLRDTLVVKVVLEKEALFIEEQLTPNSASFLRGEITETFRYPVELQNNQIVLRERSESRLFFFYDSDYLPLDFPALMPTAYQNGCQLNLGETPFTGNDLVQFPSFEVGPIGLYNKAAVSCRPISEGDGYLIYDKNRLYLSHTIITLIDSDDRIWSMRMDGWELLDD